MVTVRPLVPGLDVVGSRGRYRLERDLGGQPEGTLWSARDFDSSKMMTLRLLPSSEISGAHTAGPNPARAALLSSIWLDHPRVARILGWDQLRDDGTQVLLFEPLEGETLAARIAREGPLPPNEALTIAAELSDALTAGHRVGVVHGGLTTSSVLVSAAGVKVIDFGLGTGSRPADPAADVLGLVSLLREMLGGDPSVELAGPVAKTCRAALATDPSARPSMKVLASSLRATADQPLAGQQAAALVPVHGGPGRPGRTPHRRKRLAVLAVAVAGSIALVTSIAVLGDGRTGQVATRTGPEASQAGGGPASGVTVPHLSGFSALQARSRLLALGLRVGGLEPAIGLPGQVVRQDPSWGQSVTPGSSVILYVGVTPERFEELQGSG